MLLKLVLFSYVFYSMGSCADVPIQNLSNPKKDYYDVFANELYEFISYISTSLESNNIKPYNIKLSENDIKDFGDKFLASILETIGLKKNKILESSEIEIDKGNSNNTNSLSNHLKTTEVRKMLSVWNDLTQFMMQPLIVFVPSLNLFFESIRTAVKAADSRETEQINMTLITDIVNFVFELFRAIGVEDFLVEFPKAVNETRLYISKSIYELSNEYMKNNFLIDKVLNQLSNDSIKSTINTSNSNDYTSSNGTNHILQHYLNKNEQIINEINNLKIYLTDLVKENFSQVLTTLSAVNCVQPTTSSSQSQLQNQLNKYDEVSSYVRNELPPLLLQPITINSQPATNTRQYEPNNIGFLNILDKLKNLNPFSNKNGNFLFSEGVSRVNNVNNNLYNTNKSLELVELPLIIDDKNSFAEVNTNKTSGISKHNNNSYESNQNKISHVISILLENERQNKSSASLSEIFNKTTDSIKTNFFNTLEVIDMITDKLIN